MGTFSSHSLWVKAGKQQASKAGSSSFCRRGNSKVHKWLLLNHKSDRWVDDGAVVIKCGWKPLKNIEVNEVSLIITKNHRKPLPNLSSLALSIRYIYTYMYVFILINSYNYHKFLWLTFTLKLNILSKLNSDFPLTCWFTKQGFIYIYSLSFSEDHMHIIYIIHYYIQWLIPCIWESTQKIIGC